MRPFPLPDVPSRFAPTHWNRVGDWMREVGGARLRKADGACSAQDLLDYILRAVVHATPSNQGEDARYGLTWTKIEARAAETAAWLIGTYRPRHTLTNADRRKGGSNSKRHSPLLDQFAKLPDEARARSNAEVAKILVCHPRSVQKVRAAYRRLVWERTPEIIREVEGLEPPTDPRHASGLNHDLSAEVVDKRFQKITSEFDYLLEGIEL